MGRYWHHLQRPSARDENLKSSTAESLMTVLRDVNSKYVSKSSRYCQTLTVYCYWDFDIPTSSEYLRTVKLKLQNLTGIKLQSMDFDDEQSSSSKGEIGDRGLLKKGQINRNEGKKINGQAMRKFGRR